MKPTVGIAVLSIVISFAASAANYVDPVGGNDETAVPGSETLKYKTIQAAIDNCPANGTVSLADGTYEQSATLMLANGVQLIGTGYEKCVICAAAKKTIRLVIMEGSNTLLQGVTVCGGVRDASTNWADACGAGIMLKGGTVSHCMISNNVMNARNVWGGGVYACSGTITHCIIAKNTSGGDFAGISASGGGLGCGIASLPISGPILIDRCLFFGNQATAQAGGIYNGGSGSESVTIRNCTVSGNRVLLNSGSAGLSGSTAKLLAVESCIFTDNLKNTKTEPQVANCSITSATIFKNCLFGNGEAAQGAGSISGDAKFVSSENGDYHLQADSDAIDKGLVSEAVTPDLDDRLILDGKPDIGCYEHQIPGITVSGEPGAWGHPDPDYGTYADVVADETYSFVAPAAVTNAEGTACGTCRGWRLMDSKGKVYEGTGTATTLVYEMENGPYILTWLWDTTYRVTATAVDGGTVDFTEAWMKEGTELTVTASETDTAKLWSWFGGVDKATRRELTQTLTVDRPFALVAKFYDPEGAEKLVAYVSPTGAGNKDGYDADNANDSIADALALVSVENAAGGEVRFVAGTYAVSETLPLRQNLSYIGATDGESVLDGEGLNKVVCFDGSSAGDVAGGALENLVLSNCTAGCVSFAANSGDFTVTGCRFTAGKYGIAASSVEDSRLIVSNCAFIALSTSTDRAAAVNVSGALVPTLVDCLFKGNAGSSSGNSASLGFTYNPNVSGKVAVLRQCRFEDNRSLDCCNGAIVHHSNGVSSGLYLHGCTFLRNSCTMRPDSETNVQRSPCLSVPKPGSGVYVFDSYFGYNTLTNTATGTNPKIGSVIACADVSGKFLFFNCTFEHNSLRTVNSSDYAGTITVGYQKQIGIAHCVFNENDVIHVDATTGTEDRCGELQVGSGSFATGLFDSIFTHSAEDYAYCASDSDSSRQYWVTMNCNIKNYTTPSAKGWRAHWVNITADDQPKLDKLRDNGCGLLARGVASDSPFRKCGSVWRVANTGMPYLYSKSGFGTLSKNTWMPLTPSDSVITDEAAADLELTTQTPPMADAFGAARREKWIAYGPLNAPPRGLMLLVR